MVKIKTGKREKVNKIRDSRQHLQVYHYYKGREENFRYNRLNLYPVQKEMLV